MITASSYHRVAVDEYDEPQGCAKFVNGPPGPAAEFGTKVHALVERYVTTSLQPSGDGDEVRHALQAAMWLAPIFDGETTVLSEVGLLYNAPQDTATNAPRRGEPGYNVTPPMHMRGTIDLAWVSDNGVLYVVDIKTGKPANAHKEQLYFQAVAMSRLLKVYTARVGFLFTRLTKVIPPDLEELDADRLDAEAGRIYRTLKRLPVMRAKVGDYCRWCAVEPGKCEAGGKGPPEVISADYSDYLEAEGEVYSG